MFDDGFDDYEMYYLYKLYMGLYLMYYRHFFGIQKPGVEETGLLDIPAGKIGGCLRQDQVNTKCLVSLKEME